MIVSNLFTFPITAAPTWDARTFTTGFLRYLRWEVATLSAGATVTFWLGGLGRTYG